MKLCASTRGRCVTLRYSVFRIFKKLETKYYKLPAKLIKLCCAKEQVMTTVTESSGDGSNSSSVIERLKAMDLIDQLEIADGLKQLLLSKDFTLKSLLNASSSDFCKNPWH